MNIISDNTSETHYYVRGFMIESAEPYLIAHRNYSHGGKHFLPEGAQARWDHDKPIQEISVSGPVLNKDGKPSKNRTAITFNTPASPYWGRAGTMSIDAPAWLLELFDIEVPE